MGIEINLGNARKGEGLLCRFHTSNDPGGTTLKNRTPIVRHPFQPECLRVAALALDLGDPDRESDVFFDLIAAIDAGLCPRCRGPLAPIDVSQPPEHGSHITECRCVPVCWWCFDHELEQRNSLKDPAGRRVSSASEWPVGDHAFVVDCIAAEHGYPAKGWQWDIEDVDSDTRQAVEDRVRAVTS